MRRLQHLKMGPVPKKTNFPAPLSVPYVPRPSVPLSWKVWQDASEATLRACYWSGLLLPPREARELQGRASTTCAGSAFCCNRDVIGAGGAATVRWPVDSVRDVASNGALGSGGRPPRPPATKELEGLPPRAAHGVASSLG